MWFSVLCASSLFRFCPYSLTTLTLSGLLCFRYAPRSLASLGSCPLSFLPFTLCYPSLHSYFAIVLCTRLLRSCSLVVLKILTSNVHEIHVILLASPFAAGALKRASSLWPIHKRKAGSIVAQNASPFIFGPQLLCRRGIVLHSKIGVIQKSN